MGFLIILLGGLQSLGLSFGKDLRSESRYLSASAENKLGSVFRHRTETGFWTAGGGSASLYGSDQFGIRSENDVLYADAYTGVALITKTDHNLSTPFQFKHDIGLGILGKTGVGIGLSYSHLSNGGLRMPNLGRDSLQIRFNFPL